MKNGIGISPLVTLMFVLALTNSFINNDKSKAAPAGLATSAVSDITTTTTSSDGNVTISNQEWALKNLDVTTYRNGDIIPQVTDATQWAGLTTGAWCYYNNDSANAAVYGKLYNWYAVNDPRGLSPLGWHIPTDAEWATLITFLGGESVAGGKMKATILWNSPNTGATNESDFTGLPGGYRGSSGVFNRIGGNGYWWSSSKYSALSAWSRYLGCYYGSIGRDYDDERFGESVRCLRD
jgi:uncharacterized protein (TIGR02145 family)